MPATPIPAFTPDTTAAMAATNVSSRIALPGTLGGDTVVRVANAGPDHACVVLGSSSVVAVLNTSLMIPAGQVQYLAIGSATYIAAICPSTNATLNITTGN